MERLNENLESVISEAPLQNRNEARSVTVIIQPPSGMKYNEAVEKLKTHLGIQDLTKSVYKIRQAEGGKILIIFGEYHGGKALKILRASRARLGKLWSSMLSGSATALNAALFSTFELRNVDPTIHPQEFLLAIHKRYGIAKEDLHFIGRRLDRRGCVRITFQCRTEVAKGLNGQQIRGLGWGIGIIYRLGLHKKSSNSYEHEARFLR